MNTRRESGSAALNVLLINHRAEAMERQKKVIADNTCASKINTCRPGLSVVEATRNFIPDFVILQTGGCSIYCLDTVDHLIEKNPQVYILLIAESEDQELLERALDAGVDDFISGMPSDSELILRVKMGLRCAAQNERRFGAVNAPAEREETPAMPGLLAAGIKVAGNVIFGVLVLFMAVMAFFLVQSKYSGEVPSVFGYRVYMVLSGSMSPTFDTGSVVFVRPEDPAIIRKGDIITFSGEGSDMLTTHRVVDVQNEEGLKFITRGDANNVDDPKPVPAENVVGRVHGSLPYLGYLMGFAQTRRGLIFLVFIPGVLVILFELRNIFKYMRETDQERKTGRDGEENPAKKAPQYMPPPT
jgi:signal peptidase